MTNNQLSRERAQQIFLGNGPEPSASEERELARMALAVIESEPVAYSLIFRNMDGVLNNYINTNTTFSTREKAEAYGKGGSYEVRSDGKLEWVPNTALDPVVVPLYRHAQQTVDNTFIPKNLDKALGVVGVALPESKEEFNFQIERWIQRLIDRVIRYSDEFKEQPAPVVPKEWAIADAVKFCRETGRQDAGAAMDAWNACRAAMLQAGNCRENSNSSTNNFREIAETSTGTAITPAAPDKKLTDDVLDEIIAGAKTSMEQYLALSLKAEREVWRKEGPTDDERIMAIEDMIGCLRCGDNGWVVGEMGITRCACGQAGNSPVIPGWIPVSERLPDEGGRYLAWVQQQNDLGLSQWADNVGYQPDSLGFRVTGRVTHWMPLPAAPKQENI